MLIDIIQKDSANIRGRRLYIIKLIITKSDYKGCL